MQLYFLRHGEADWPGWTEPDDERPLTDFGKKEVRQVAKFLDRLNVNPDLIVSSPLPRALQTAEAAAEQLKTKLHQDEALEPGFGINELSTVLQRHPSKALMLVGHEPDFSLFATHLLGFGDGSRLRIRKASLTHIELPAFAPGAGILQFSLPCRLM
jgi:phosphohistidine phosphatase